MFLIKIFAQHQGGAQHLRRVVPRDAVPDGNKRAAQRDLATAAEDDRGPASVRGREQDERRAAQPRGAKSARADRGHIQESDEAAPEAHGDRLASPRSRHGSRASASRHLPLGIAQQQTL